MKILDVGCGLNPRGDVNIDIDFEKLRKVKNLHKVEFICSSAEYLPIKSNSFDLVIAIHVLDHCNDFIKALLELIRVSKREVRIVISHRFCRCFRKGKDHKIFPSTKWVWNIVKLLRKMQLIKSFEVNVKQRSLLILQLPYEIEVRLLK